MENTHQWLQRVDEITREFKDHFGELSATELNQKPNGQTWSIAENMEHLIAVNSSYFPILDSLKAGKYKTSFLGKLSFFVNFMGKTILKSVAPDRRQKMKTFPIWEPKKANVAANIVELFEQHQERLKTLIKDSAPFIEKGTVIASPANKNIVYTLEKAVEIMIAHEQRHHNQALEAFDVIFKNQYKLDL